MNPTMLRSPISSSLDSDSTRPCTGSASSQEQQADLPTPLSELLAHIRRTIQSSFAQKPPHTVQRLAELILYPRAHYKTLPAYLRAVEKVVSVSSGADVFLLPVTSPLPGAMRGTLNGFGGSMLSCEAVAEDQSADGPALTPIPWLNNNSMFQSFTTMPNQSPHSPRPPQDPTEAPEPEDEVPHARGPEVLGVEDLGPQKHLDTETMSTEEALRHSSTNTARAEHEGDAPNAERDADGDTEMLSEPATDAGHGAESRSLEEKMEDEHPESNAIEEGPEHKGP
ncbi:Protein phosphatase 4 core regulatory subunit R2 [Ascosphaera apis ARSEF 7405]|uniref:Protein phosphatase 4 core regulatory subunit R2 n=1 Tax=Ascosphaera apis ARSEF 7405 TaxID=392613 RepID=A0A168BTQ2_9EURO|nr:Protein phosphatase 4 core regulatory subunit R2 [Ascosphaera apis ARSEF 7405]